MIAGEEVILVDRYDQPIGTMEKLKVHQEGILHRAFSVFIFNIRHELLLQQRAKSKYHSPELWSNSCCSHPRPGEETEQAAQRRVQEELGLFCDLKYAFTFSYCEKLDNGLTEHELDHVFIGYSDERPNPDPTEIMDWTYVSLPDLQKVLQQNENRFTVWLKISLPLLMDHLEKNVHYAA